MTRQTKTVWTGADEHELLELKPSGKFYIPLSTVSKDELAELGLAITDALTGAAGPTPGAGVGQ
jgi:hypothetical protein